MNLEGVILGCVMYLCLKKTVSEMHLLHAALTKMKWHL